MPDSSPIPSGSGQGAASPIGVQSQLADANFVRGVFSLLLGRGVSDGVLSDKLSQSRAEVVKRALVSTEFLDRTTKSFLTADTAQKQLSPIVSPDFISDVISSVFGSAEVSVEDSGEFTGWTSAFFQFLSQVYAVAPGALASLGGGGENQQALEDAARLSKEIAVLIAQGRYSRVLAVAAAGVGDGLNPLAPVIPVTAILAGASQSAVSMLADRYSAQLGAEVTQAFRALATTPNAGGLIVALSNSPELTGLLPHAFGGHIRRLASDPLLANHDSMDEFIDFIMSTKICEGEANLPIDDVKLTIVAPSSSDVSAVTGNSDCKIEAVKSLSSAPFKSMSERPVVLVGGDLDLDADSLDKLMLSLSYGRSVILVGVSESTVGADLQGNKVVFAQSDAEPVAVAVSSPQSAAQLISVVGDDVGRAADQLEAVGALRVHLKSKNEIASTLDAREPVSFTLVDVRTSKQLDWVRPEASASPSAMVSMSPTKLDVSPEITGAQLAEQLKASLSADLSCPVIILSDDFEYSPGYAEDMALRAIRSASGTVNCARGLEIGRESNKLQLSPSSEIASHYAALLSCSAVSAEIAIKVLENHGAGLARETILTLPHLIQEWGTNTSLINASKTDLFERLNNDVSLLTKVHESRKSRGRGLVDVNETDGDAFSPSFVDRSIARKRTNLLRQMSEVVLKRGNASAREMKMLFRKELHPLFLSLIETGHKQSICQFLSSVSGDISALKSLDADDLREMLTLAKIAGQHEEVAARLLPVARQVISRNHQKVIPLFSFLAGASEQQEFTSSLMMTFTESILSDDRDRINIRFLDIVTRFCNSLAVMSAVRLIDEKRPKLLELDSIQRLLARHLGYLQRTPLVLPNSRLDVEAIRQSLNPREQLVEALLRGGREEVIHLMRLLVDAGERVTAIVDAVRPYTYELSALQITAEDWPYHLICSPLNTLRIAAILGDEAMVKQFAPRVIDDPVLGAVAGAIQGDNSGLDTVYAQCAARLGVREMTFKGDSIVELFEELLRQAATFERSELAADGSGPLISVIMTVFNPDIELLKLSLKSVLSQTYQNFEIFLVDDCSEPDSRTQVIEASRLDPRIHFLDTGKNVGPYLGRNLALNRARGDFIAIQDGDDFAHPQRFERQLAAFKEFPDIYGTASTHYRFDVNGRIQFEHGLNLDGDGTMSSMFRRAAFDEIGGFESVRSRGDVEFRERIRSAFGPGAFLQFSDPLMFCNSSPATLSHTVNRTKREHLQEFRTNFSQMAWDYSSNPATPAGVLAVPFGLKP